MTQLKTLLFRAAAFLGIAFVCLIVAGLAAPFIGDSLQKIRAELPTNKGTSGLIYVESPEVYTRQRLVNDRYLQDAWLRDQLDVIDLPSTSWIDTETRDVRHATLGFGKPDGTRDTAEPDGEETLETTESAGNADNADVSISFTEKFKLQSNARDKIRQMILENALDDRHDLSGNTVFGLKFDTSVLPGDRTTLNPTVIVRMDANPLDRFDEPHQFAPFFNKSYWSSREGIAQADVELLEESGFYYDNWVSHLEARLNKQRAIVTASETHGPVLPQGSCLAEKLCAPQSAHFVSASQKETEPFVLAENREALIDTELRQREDVEAALRFVLRIPERNLTFRNRILDQYRNDAEFKCTTADPGRRTTAPSDVTVRNLFFSQGDVGFSREFPLPGELAPFFELRVDPRVPSHGNDCELDLDIRLKKKEIPILLFSAEAGSSAAPGSAGLQYISCGAWFCRDYGMEVWVPREQFQAAFVALDDRTLEALFPRATVEPLLTRTEEGEVWEVCTTEDFYFDRRPGEEKMDWEGLNCAPGLIATFEVGPYHFLRKMAAVESYIYAAFPRGDVSGVVSKIETGVSANGAVSTAYGTGAIGLSDSSEETKVSAAPSLINFASGDQHELFDFGWSIVQDGVKEPMIASQLVLISVPAYLRQLRLEIVKGFLDVNKMPSDWKDWRREYRQIIAPGQDGAGASYSEIATDDTKRAQLLASRVERLFEGWERRTIELKVPPDYRSLDNILFGNDDLGGPLINEADIKAPDCYDFDDRKEFVLPIPGDRLWRSTVVTLDGQRASKIEVLPDMRGILATFKPQGGTGEVATQQGVAAVSKASAGPVSRRLTVWTSEGNNSVTVEFCGSN